MWCVSGSCSFPSVSATKQKYQSLRRKFPQQRESVDTTCASPYFKSSNPIMLKISEVCFGGWHCVDVMLVNCRLQMTTQTLNFGLCSILSFSVPFLFLGFVKWSFYISQVGLEFTTVLLGLPSTRITCKHYTTLRLRYGYYYSYKICVCSLCL